MNTSFVTKSLKKKCYKNNTSSTSWENVASWYNNLVNKEGHFYHTSLIIPLLKQQLNFTSISSVVDLGCGQGILSRHIPKKVNYLGIDISKTLIHQAKNYSKNNSLHHFFIYDLCTPLTKYSCEFECALAILSLQNMANPSQAIANASHLLKKNGTFIVILNHPCFRIPRQTSWDFDESQQTCYRRINAYLTPKVIPITMHPGTKQHKETTKTFHFPLSYWVNALCNHGFSSLEMEELVSNKISEGGRKKAENNIRKEIPLFLMLKAKKM